MPAYVYTTSVDMTDSLRAEHEAATTLSLPAHLTNETDLPFEVELALRFDDQARIDVGPYMMGLAELSETAGGTIFEYSRAVDLHESISGVSVATDAGSVSADVAVVATLIPVFDRGGYFARMKPSRAYGVAARLKSGGLDGVHINAGSPTRTTRPWEDGQGTGIVVVGEGHPTGDGSASPGRELERWAREHFDVDSFEYSSQRPSSIESLRQRGDLLCLHFAEVASAG